MNSFNFVIIFVLHRWFRFTVFTFSGIFDGGGALVPPIDEPPLAMGHVYIALTCLCSSVLYRGKVHLFQPYRGQTCLGTTLWWSCKPVCIGTFWMLSASWVKGFSNRQTVPSAWTWIFCAAVPSFFWNISFHECRWFKGKCSCSLPVSGLNRVCRNCCSFTPTVSSTTARLRVHYSLGK